MITCMSPPWVRSPFIRRISACPCPTFHPFCRPLYTLCTMAHRFDKEFKASEVWFLHICYFIIYLSKLKKRETLFPAHSVFHTVECTPESELCNLPCSSSKPLVAARNLAGKVAHVRRRPAWYGGLCYYATLRSCDDGGRKGEGRQEVWLSKASS